MWRCPFRGTSGRRRASRAMAGWSPVVVVTRGMRALEGRAEVPAPRRERLEKNSSCCTRGGPISFSSFRRLARVVPGPPVRCARWSRRGKGYSAGGVIGTASPFLIWKQAPQPRSRQNVEQANRGSSCSWPQTGQERSRFFGRPSMIAGESGVHCNHHWMARQGRESLCLTINPG